MVTLDLDSLLPPLYLCDPEHGRFADMLVCMWDAEPCGSQDLLFTVVTEEEIEIGFEFEVADTRWVITGVGNGWVARPVSEVQ